LRKAPALTKLLALLVLISSMLIFVEDVRHFDLKTAKIAFRGLPKQSSRMYDVEEYNKLRQEALFSKSKQAIFYLALIVAIFSSFIVLIRGSRTWHIFLGSASFASLVMFLIIFLKYSPFSFQKDIPGATFACFFCAINLLSAIYFLPRSKIILTNRSSRPEGLMLL
jgi:hypothetical protein